MRFLAILAAVAVLAAAVSVSILQPSPDVRAQQGPAITFQFPQEGDVLAEPPQVLQMCFAVKVNFRDPPVTPVGPSPSPTGDFIFDVIRPGGLGLGVRIVFQPDGYGVALYPNVKEQPIPDGAWTWKYRVTDYTNTHEATEGTVHFSVDSRNGKPILQPTPPPCMGPNTPGPTLIQVGSPDASATPGSSPAAGDSAGDSGGGPDILLLALLTVGAAGGAAIIALIGYVIRNKVGFWMHRPPPRDGGDEGEHH